MSGDALATVFVNGGFNGGAYTASDFAARQSAAKGTTISGLGEAAFGNPGAVEFLKNGVDVSVSFKQPPFNGDQQLTIDRQLAGLVAGRL